MYRVAILTLLVAVVLPQAVFAGAWTINRGTTRTFVTSTFTYGNHSFDENGKLVKVPEYRKFNLTATLEYGVRDWLTAIVKSELSNEYSYRLISDAFFDDPIFGGGNGDVFGFRTQTFGSIGAGARLRVINAAPAVVSVEVSGGSGGFDTSAQQADSDGPFLEARANIGIGQELIGRSVFGSASAGYRFRFDSDDADEVLFDATLGARLLPRWMVLAQSFNTIQTEGNSFNSKASASVVYRATQRLQVQASGLATVAGRNTIQELGGSLGFWWAY